MATHDYVIDNSTGANVRSDLNNVLQAILTNNSSSSAPTTTAAYMWWADTTNGVLKIRNSANDGWVELLQLDGTITLENGTETNPALAFRDDLNTGIFSSSDNVLDIATGGVSRLQIDTTEITFNESGENTDLRIEGDNEANLFFVDAGNDKIGIGINAPSSRFSIVDTATFTAFASAVPSASQCMLQLFNNPSSEAINNHATIQFGVNGGTHNRIASISAVAESAGNRKIALAFCTDSGSNRNERMRLTGDGQLGIGTSGPSRMLHIKSDGVNKSHIALIDNDSTNEVFRVGQQSDGDGFLQLLNDDAQAKVALEASGDTFFLGGNVGIGTSVPSDFNTDSNNLVIRTAGNTGMTISGSTGGECQLAYTNGADTGVEGILTYQHGNNDFLWAGLESDSILSLRTGSYNRIRLFSDGDIFLGGAANADRTGSGNTKGFVYDNDTTTANNQEGGNHPFICIQHASKTTGAASYINFQSQTVVRGSIVESNSGNNVTYNTSSDYRLKQDEVIISDGITRLKQLKPYQFKWKDDLDFGYVDGFFAHEVGDVVKGAATGTKDEVVTQSGIDDGTYKGAVNVGDPVIQGLDYSRITPLLTAALQEAVAKIETLETKVAALEAA